MLGGKAAAQRPGYAGCVHVARPGFRYCSNDCCMAADHTKDLCVLIVAGVVLAHLMFLV